MAGDINVAKQICREYCFDIGLCVTIEPVDYIYTGGEESGFRIGLINYPRFPCSRPELESKAKELASILREKLFQKSYSIVFPDSTYYFSTMKDE